jgi:hypothetical protein
VYRRPQLGLRPTWAKTRNVWKMQKRAEGRAQVVGHLPSNCKALSFNPRLPKKPKIKQKSD